ncbi:MAG: arlS 1 [Firmicutes bacterium]|nr:arlS 1 [Bacillota bacterium]
MWSKIKPLALPISIKLTIIYTIILSFILLFTNILVLAGTSYELSLRANEDIDLTTDDIKHYVEANKPLNSQLLVENPFTPGVIVKVFDSQYNLLIDNTPKLPNDGLLAKKEVNSEKFLKNLFLLKKKALQIVYIGHDKFYYKHQIILHDNSAYHIYILKSLNEERHFLKTLAKGFIVTNVIGLVIAIIAGLFLSRRILLPLRIITNTAKEIEVNNLGKRIAETTNKDELQELARTFNHMLNRIQSGFEQQRRFVGDASHELRTPITVISGYVDMLDRWGKHDPAVLDEGISAIKSEAANMYALIEKLLFLARTDQNRQLTTKAPLDMQSFIDGIVQETQLIAPYHQIQLCQNDQVTIYADASAIKQMLRIFIDNSIKYTPLGGTISVTSRKVDNHLEIAVSDTGIGIPEAEQNKIFDRFYRVDRSRSKETGGAGLGLSIAKWIAANHSSTIQLSSQPGDGTTVTVKIPIKSVSHQPRRE